MAKGGAKILFGLFFTLVLAGGLGGGGAWYLTEHRVEDYRATLMLIMESETGGANADAPASDWDASVYGEYFASDRVATKLHEKVRELYASNGVANPPEQLDAIRKAMRVETSVALQTASKVVYSPVIRLHYTASNPAVAAGAVNAWGHICEELTALRQSLEQQLVLDRVTNELEQVRLKLEDARKAQAALRAASPLEPLEVAAVEGARTVESMKATIRELEGSAARDDAALKALKAYVSKAPVAVALELSVKEADAEAALAGSKAESEYAIAKLAEVQAAQTEAQTRWAESRPKHDAADAEVARLSERLRALELRTQEFNSAENAISIPSEATVPEAPVGPHRYVIVAGAAVLGALAGLILYFGLLTLRVYARALDRA